MWGCGKSFEDKVLTHWHTRRSTKRRLRRAYSIRGARDHWISSLPLLKSVVPTLTPLSLCVAADTSCSRLPTGLRASIQTGGRVPLVSLSAAPSSLAHAAHSLDPATLRVNSSLSSAVDAIQLGRERLQQIVITIQNNPSAINLSIELVSQLATQGAAILHLIFSGPWRSNECFTCNIGVSYEST